MKNLKSLNKVLLCKWSWRFSNEKGALWIEVIKGKYGEEEGGWNSCIPREGYGMSLWRSIGKWGHVVSNEMSFVVGDGKRIKSWSDSWCGDTPLCADFPSLFALARAKEAWVGDVWRMEQGRGC